MPGKGGPWLERRVRSIAVRAHSACLPGLPAWLQVMEEAPKVAMLPVVDDGRLRGLVTLHALVSAGL